MLPAKDKSFDPTRIPKAIRDAGFSPREIEVTAAGTLTLEDELLLLVMPGRPRQFVLAGGAKIDEIRKRRDLLGKRLRVSGKLHPSHADKPPGLSVERWTSVDQSE